MLSSATGKSSEVSMASSRIITVSGSAVLANAQAIRADGLGNIYYAGNGTGSPSNYTRYNTVTGSTTTGLVPSVDFNASSWDVDAAGNVYYMIGNIVYRTNYGQIMTITGTAYTKSFSVRPDGTAFYLQVDGNMIMFTGVPGNPTSNLLMTNAYGTGRIVSSADSYGNVYIGGRADLTTSNATLKVTSAGASSSFSSNTYARCGSISFDRLSGNAVVATSNAVFRVTPTKDVQIASGFTLISGVAVDSVSKICYVYEDGGASRGIYRLTPQY